MNYPESVRFLYSLGNEIKTAKLGIERIALLLDRLGNPQQSCSFVHVAGTNGKGSVCAMIEAGLREAGVRTGLFTSPHLAEPTERIQIDGSPVTTELFTEAFEQVHRTAELMLEDSLLDCHPTYFETVTAMALLLFRDQRVETGVLEVGLGGRLDATNLVTPRLCVITPVDFDHEAFLGKSLEAIALEKAGILKPGVPLVLAEQRPELETLIGQRAAQTPAPLLPVRSWSAEGLELDPRGSRFTATGPGRIPVECPLAGEHQVGNALTAVAALHALDIPSETIRRGIRQTHWPGRLEHVSRNPEIILDGAHNPAGARALADYIRRFYGDRTVWLVFGSMRDKAVTEMAGILFPYAQRLILTAPDNPRAVRPEAIRDLTDHPCPQTAVSLKEALRQIGEASEEDVVFISGSLFLVGEARALLVK